MSDTIFSPTTSCSACDKRIMWTELVDGSHSWTDCQQATGCPDPLQPNEGWFPHVPIDDTPEFG